MPARRLDQIVLAALPRQPDEQVQAGGDAGRRGVGEEGRERIQQGVASASIDRSHATQMARKAALVDEPSEGQLAKRLGRDVVKELRPE